jgi:chromosome segregation ATPase
MDAAIDRLLDIYASAMATPRAPGDALRAAARHLSRIARPLKEADLLAARLDAAARDLAAARARADALVVQVADGSDHVGRLEQAVSATHRELAAARHEAQSAKHQAQSAKKEAADLRGEVAAFRSLATLKLRDAVLRTPLIGPLLQSGARGVVKRLRT